MFSEFLVISNLLLLAALVMAGDSKIRAKDSNGFIAYGIIFVSFVLRRFISAGSQGYNLWLVLLLVILIHNNQQVQDFVDNIRTKIGFWLFVLMSFLVMLIFKMLEYTTHLLSPILIVMILGFIAWSAKKRWYDKIS